MGGGAQCRVPAKIDRSFRPEQRGGSTCDRFGPKIVSANISTIEACRDSGEPPHKITFVVAFRRDYAPTWMDFEHDELADRRQQVMPLRLFTEAQAKDVTAVIADAADFTMDNALADDLVESMKNDEAHVSPVDIGIRLLALNERALGKPGRHLDKGDYRIAGGAAAGLLAEYVSNQLDRYQPGEQSTILATLLELADLSKDQRLSEGRTPAQLAEKVPLPTGVLDRYLKDLASPQVRLLEALPGGAYRLPHERLIPALRQLSGLRLAAAEQASRTFNQAYSDWVAGQRRRALLLRGSRLRDVVRHRRQLNWGTDRAEKEEFLRQSLRGRNWSRAASGVAVAALPIVIYLAWGQFESLQNMRDLESWRQPAALYSGQDQLVSLALNSSQLTHLRWLRHCLKTLSLRTPLLDGLSDLPDCKGLTNLTLDLGNGVNSLDALRGLKGLTKVTVHLSDSGVNSLDALKDLKGLTNLMLSLGRGVTRLDALKDLKGLTNLSLYLGNGGVNSLDALRGLKGLTKVTVHLSDSGVNSLDALKDLKDLTDLSLDLRGSGVTRLSVVRNLSALRTLAVMQNQHYELGKLPQSLAKLSLSDGSLQ
jgi:hypothetical protein